MKPIFYEKEIDTIVFLKKQMNSKEVVDIVGLSQFKVNMVRKKHFENTIMPKGSRLQALTT
jgi:hypothetical protein